jgi:nickel-type superoxide dismutase maturation protease
MFPTFKPGVSVVASPLPYFFCKPKVGDVIVGKDPRSKRPIIKRIADIDQNSYSLAGDNPSESTDSRQFGMINRSSIIGKVIFIIRP